MTSAGADALGFFLAWGFCAASIAGLSWLIGYIVGGEHMRRRMLGKVRVR